MAEPINVLVVDDNEDLLETLALILKRRGFNVDTAPDGEAAVSKFEAGDFDVALMDVVMPRMNGVEAFQKIKETHPDAAVVLMTAYSEEELIQTAIDGGVHRVIHKPISIDQMVELLKEAAQGQEILIIDDDEDILHTMSRALEIEGYRVQLAASGEEALKIIREKSCEMAFVDVKLPLMDGLETYLRLKEIKPNIKAVMMTGYRDEVKDALQKAQEAKAIDCLFKPFSPVKAVELVSKFSGQVVVMENQKSILVVDDEPDFLAVIKRILEFESYEVTTAATATRAIARAKERFFNAAVLDISLPDIDGTELLSILLKDHPDTIAVMLTGHSSVQNAVTSLNRGAYAYLEKPLNPERLLSVLEQGLEKQHLILENRRLVRELEERTRNTGILLDVSQAVARSHDLQQKIDVALGKIRESLGIEAVYLYLLEENLVLKGQTGFPPGLLEQMEKGAGDAVVNGVFRNGEPRVITDVAGEPGLDFMAKAGYRSVACVPLNILAKSLGVLGAANRSLREFSQSEVNLISAIGREIAIAVQNSRLAEQESNARALQELDALRTEFLANVSHELRTPLAVIKGAASSLLQPDVVFDEATRSEFLRSIDNDADRLSRLVNDLLMMSRLEAGTLELNKEPHSLSSVLAGVRDRLDSLTVRHKLNIDIPQDLPLLMVDDGRIGEVLTNLVENATKFAKTGTRITITASPDSGREVIISVSDEGIGIPDGLHEKIFERFYQVESSKRGNRKGTGLGLAICRGIVEAHGGRIWVDSAAGKGTTFSFGLPVNGNVRAGKNKSEVKHG